MPMQGVRGMYAHVLRVPVWWRGYGLVVWGDGVIRVMVGTGSVGGESGGVIANQGPSNFRSF